MDDMMSRISEILDDPVQAERIKNLASSFMTPSASQSAPEPSAETSADITPVPVSESAMSARMPEPSMGAIAGLTEIASSVAGLISKSGIMRSMPSSESINRNINLLNAIRPYMRAERANRLSNAVKVMQILSSIAKLK